MRKSDEEESVGTCDGIVELSGSCRITRTSTPGYEGDTFGKKMKMKKKKIEEKEDKEEIGKKENKRKRNKMVLFIDEVSDKKGTVPLVEIINVESYKRYNDPYPENYGGAMGYGDDDGKAYCNCACFIF